MSSTPSTTPLEALKHSVNTLKAPFACGGSIKLDSLGQSPLICYRPVPISSQAQETASIATLPLDSSVLAQIHEVAVPSPHGVGGETVFDPSYRDARQITIDNFAMNFDPMSMEHGILSAISQLSVTNSSAGLFARLYKLNSYSVGGFFKAHRDTPKGVNHVGSIVVCLPSKFTGGELIVRHHGDEVKFDFKDASEKDQVAWAFLFSDCEHEVLPVLTGTRVTLAYEVFCRQDQSAVDLAVILRGSKLYQALENVVKSQKDPLKIGISFRHAYPMETETEKGNESYLKDLPGRLKGFDAELYFTAKSLGLETSFVAIYKPDDDEDEEYSDASIGDEDEEKQGGDVPLTSYNFHAGQWGDNWEGGQTSLLKYNGAKFDRSVTWIRVEGEKFIGGSYLAHGNEAWLAHIYASAGVIITIKE